MAGRVAVTLMRPGHPLVISSLMYSNKPFVSTLACASATTNCRTPHSSVGTRTISKRPYTRAATPNSSLWNASTTFSFMATLVPKQQRRHYLYLPTSWTECKLRWNARQQKQILHVKLLKSRWKERLHVRWNKAIQNSRDGYALAKRSSRTWMQDKKSRFQTTRLSLRDQRDTYRAKVRIRMQARRIKMQESLRRIWNRSRDRLHRYVLFKTKAVTLTEYFEANWFDSAGRPLTSRDATGRFVNPWLSQSTSGVKTASAILRWRWERFLRNYQQYGWRMLIPSWSFDPKAYAATSSTKALTVTATLPPLQPAVPDDELKFTWIGHATCLVQQGDITVLTDPMFSTRASPYKNVVGVARDIPPAYDADDLPAVDVCLISHDHYDHLDKMSCIRLRDKVRGWVVPLGISEWLQDKCDIPAARIVELEWWESVKLVRNEQGAWLETERRSLATTQDNAHPSTSDPAESNQMWLTCCPVQHWASRTFFDRNYRLWCAFAVFFPRATFFFGGDTALPPSFPLFEIVSDYLGPLNLAALPIGAYEPDFMMRDAHMHPSEALLMHKALRVDRSVGIHWGTFALSEEPMDEPPRLLQSCIDRDPDRDSIDFVTIPNGDSLIIRCETPVLDSDQLLEGSSR